MDIMSIIASFEKEPTFFDGVVGMILGGVVCVFVMWFSMLLLGMKLPPFPDLDVAKEAKKYNDELVKRRPWMIWLVFIASIGSVAATFLWYCGWQVPSIH